MDIKHAEGDANAFLAENRHRRVVLFTMHRDGQLVLVWVSFSANLHRSIIDHDVMGVESYLVVRVVIVGREDEGTTINHKKVDLRRIFDVNEEAEALGDCNTLAIDRGQKFSPCGFFRPQGAVAIIIALQGCISLTVDVEFEFRLLLPFANTGTCHTSD